MCAGLLNYPVDNSYGDGICRRVIRIASNPTTVSAHLSDNFHEMRCGIRHDGNTVLSIRGESLRIPTSACPAAAAVLTELIGMPINAPGTVFYGGGRALRHCTHLFDLAVIAIRHCDMGLGSVKYDAIIPDQTGNAVEVSIRRNEDLVHRWTVHDGVIVAPAKLNGRPLGKGFALWASNVFQNRELDAATILARTWLIAGGRRLRTAALIGQPIARYHAMDGRCFAYQPVRGEGTFLGGQVRSPDTL